MIEVANKSLKYGFLYHKHIENFNGLCNWLPEAVNNYNNQPHHVLDGLASVEVLNGKIVDSYTEIANRQLAKIASITENKQQKYWNYSF